MSLTNYFDIGQGFLGVEEHRGPVANRAVARVGPVAVAWGAVAMGGHLGGVPVEVVVSLRLARNSNKHFLLGNYCLDFEVLCCMRAAMGEGGHLVVSPANLSYDLLAAHFELLVTKLGPLGTFCLD